MRNLPGLGHLCALFVLVAALRAGAQNQAESPEYRLLIDQALEEYAQKNYEEARAVFVRAHLVLPSARTFRGIGMALFELRRYDECVPQLEAALASEVKPLASELRGDTEALLARARSFVARVEVRVTPAGARLRLDGADLSTPAQGELLVRLGDHSIDARAPGYAEVRRALHVRGGETLALDLTLEPLAPLVALRERPAAPQRPRLHKNPWLWTAVGALLVGAAVTTVAVVVRDSSDATGPASPPVMPPPMGVAR